MEESDLSAPKKSICILWHLKSKRILCVTPYTSTASTLMTTEPEMGFNLVSARKPILHSNEITSSLLKIQPEQLLKYIFHRQSGAVVFSDKGKAINEKQRQSCLLLSARARYLQRVTRVITRTRMRVAHSEKYGELVDYIRKEQALAFRKAGYNSEMIKDCLFVFQYAQAKKMSPKEAADEIIFRFSLFEAALWKTEEIKLKYYELFSTATTVEETHEIFQDFVREYYLNSHV